MDRENLKQGDTKKEGPPHFEIEMTKTSETDSILVSICEKNSLL